MIRYYWQIGDKVESAVLSPDDLPRGSSALRYYRENGYEKLVEPLVWHEWQCGRYRMLWWCEPADNPWWPQ